MFSGATKKLLSKYKHQAFTLAEVLVSLSIIGIIISLTVVPFITGNKIKKSIIEAKLPKFYSTMQSALKMESARRNGQSPARWKPTNNCGKPTKAECMEDYWNEYLAPHIKSRVVKRDADNVHLYIVFEDGTGVNAYINDYNTIYFFFCLDYKDCKSEIFDGRTSFLFTLHKGKFMTGSGDFHKKMTREQLLNACKYSTAHYNSTTGEFEDTNKAIRRHACAALIERDGWKIKDDYPWVAEEMEKK